MKKNNRCFKWGITAFLVILASLISYYIIFHLENFTSTIKNIFVILMPVIYGIIMAYLSTPLLNIIERKYVKPFFTLIHLEPKRGRVRACSIIITLSLVILIFYGFFALVIPQILNSIQTIIYQFPTYVDTFIAWISKVLNDNPEIETYVTDIVNRSSNFLESFLNEKILPQLNNVIMTISMSVYSVFKVLWNLIIGFIISIYLLNGKELFAAQSKKVAYALWNTETANRFISNIRFSSKTFVGFFVGKILDSAIIGVLCFIGTSLIGTPFPVLISVIIGVTNIIPFFGPFLGAIPSVLLVLMISPLQSLYLLVFILFLQQLDGNVIGPKILGDSTGLSSFWVIFSITLFGGLWGIFGMIVGVPIFAIFFAFVKSVAEAKLALQELPTETSLYMKLLYIDAETKEIVNFSEDDKKPFSNITKILVKSQTRKKIEDAKKKKETNKTPDDDK